MQVLINEEGCFAVFSQANVLHGDLAGGGRLCRPWGQIVSWGITETTPLLAIHIMCTSLQREGLRSRKRPEDQARRGQDHPVFPQIENSEAAT